MQHINTLKKKIKPNAGKLILFYSYKLLKNTHAYPLCAVMWHSKRTIFVLTLITSAITWSALLSNKFKQTSKKRSNLFYFRFYGTNATEKSL